MSTQERFDLRALRALPARPTRYDVPDPSRPGIVMTVFPSGVRTFYLIKRVGRTVERIKLAKLGEVRRIETVRDLAKARLAEITEGRDPAAERRAGRKVLTLGELWTVYGERHAKAKRSWQTNEKRYTLHLKPWASHRLDEIHRPEVTALLARIGAQSGHGASNRVRALLHHMLACAVEWGFIENNPVAGTRRYSETPKDRYLSDSELKAFWTALDATPDSTISDACKLLLLTAVRQGSLCKATWSEFSFEDRVWRIPPEHMKSGRGHELPLPDAAVEILQDRRQRVPASSPWVFASRLHAAGALGQVPKRAWRSVLGAAGVVGCTPHDLRRTWATKAVESGVDGMLIARVLGHTVGGGVTGIYARTPLSAVRRAVEKVAAAIIAVATGTQAATVLPFPSGGEARP